MELDKEELEATKRIRGKTADEMFKELGYNQRIKNYYVDSNGFSFDFISVDNIAIDNVVAITIRDLQAINKKCEELGWYE